MQAVDAILAEVHGVQSTSQANAARKRREPRRWVTAALSEAGRSRRQGRLLCLPRAET